ncbi:MAG: hypothetical protein JWR15_4261 [Prosthecobacter sp.]|nr:hypothetical protein [Prosthecobacter sp.]
MKTLYPTLCRRVALISEHASPLARPGNVDSGGQNIYVAHVARNLGLMGCAVDVFTRRDDPDLPEIQPWGRNVRVIHVPAGPAKYVRKEDLAPLMPEFARWMIGFIAGNKIRYDVLHPNFWMSGMVALTLKKELKIPFVMTFHALGPIRRMHQGQADQFPDQRDRVEAEIARCADAVIAECPQDQIDISRLYDVPAEKMPVIPCGFDPVEIWPVSKAEARASLGFDDDEKIVLQLGRIVPRKGVDLVISGLAKLRTQHGIRARLVVVGGALNGPCSDAAEMERLLHVAAKEGITGQVMLTGQRDRKDLKLFYSAADVFVTVPWYEPFGITPLEAMACGTPVIGSDVGGIRFSVQNELTGLIIPPRDTDSLAAALARIFKDPSFAQRLGRQGIRRVNEHFTWQMVTRRILALYEKVVARDRSQSAQLPAAAPRKLQTAYGLEAQRI